MKNKICTCRIYKKIKLLTEEVLKKADGSSPKMTGSPRRQRHLMSVGSVVWRTVGIEHTVLQHYTKGKAENRRVRDRRQKMKQGEQSREVRRLEEMGRFEYERKGKSRGEEEVKRRGETRREGEEKR